VARDLSVVKPTRNARHLMRIARSTFVLLEAAQQGQHRIALLCVVTTPHLNSDPLGLQRLRGKRQYCRELGKHVAATMALRSALSFVFDVNCKVWVARNCLELIVITLRLHHCTGAWSDQP
jgi:hypothetical protein